MRRSSASAASCRSSWTAAVGARSSRSWPLTSAGSRVRGEPGGIPPSRYGTTSIAAAQDSWASPVRSHRLLGPSQSCAAADGWGPSRSSSFVPGVLDCGAAAPSAGRRRAEGGSGGGLQLYPDVEGGAQEPWVCLPAGDELLGGLDAVCRHEVVDVGEPVVEQSAGQVRPLYRCGEWWPQGPRPAGWGGAGHDRSVGRSRRRVKRPVTGTTRASPGRTCCAWPSKPSSHLPAVRPTWRLCLLTPVSDEGGHGGATRRGLVRAAGSGL